MKFILILIAATLIWFAGLCISVIWPGHDFALGWVSGAVFFAATLLIGAAFEVRDVLRTERDESLNKLY